jgi:hypothetical protein
LTKNRSSVLLYISKWELGACFFLEKWQGFKFSIFFGFEIGFDWLCIGFELGLFFPR